MELLKSKYQKRAAWLGLLFLITYFFEDILSSKIWVFSFILCILAALVFIIVCFSGFYNRDKGVIAILCLVAGTVIITEALKSEIFKSQKVLEAVLTDDRSSERLILRKNHSFEIISVTMFSKDKFTGSYKIEKDKIIFDHNKAIQDTVTLMKDKIILKFDQKGEPNTDFASYYSILFTHLTNSGN